MRKFKIAGYIGYGIGILGIIISIIFGIRDKEKGNKLTQVNNYAQTIINHNYFNSLPESIKMEVENIAVASGPVVNVRAVAVNTIKREERE